jgi:Spy/CpxP family protein refolding chaperone
MRRTRIAAALLSMVLGGALALPAQTPAPKSVPTLPAGDLSKVSIGDLLGQMQPATIGGNGEAPSPTQIVVRYLQLRPDQVQEFGQLLGARQALVAPLLQGIKQQSQQLEALLNSGGSAPDVGALVIQIHSLQQQVAQAQQDFLSEFGGLLDPEQQKRLEAVRVAAQLELVLPAFRKLALL